MYVVGIVNETNGEAEAVRRREQILKNVMFLH